MSDKSISRAMKHRVKVIRVVSKKPVTGGLAHIHSKRNAVAECALTAPAIQAVSVSRFFSCFCRRCSVLRGGYMPNTYEALSVHLKVTGPARDA